MDGHRRGAMERIDRRRRRRRNQNKMKFSGGPAEEDNSVCGGTSHSKGTASLARVCHTRVPECSGPRIGVSDERMAVTSFVSFSCSSPFDLGTAGELEQGSCLARTASISRTEVLAAG